MSRKQELIDEIDAMHEWTEGTVYSGGGTCFYSTDVCEICGMERDYYSDSQNGVDVRYTYSVDGEKLTLRAALDRGCA